jgi:hypothetical protein
MEKITKEQQEALKHQPFGINVLKDGKIYLSKHFYIGRDGNLYQEK